MIGVTVFNGRWWVEPADEGVRLVVLARDRRMCSHVLTSPAVIEDRKVLARLIRECRAAQRLAMKWGGKTRPDTRKDRAGASEIAG